MEMFIAGQVPPVEFVMKIYNHLKIPAHRKKVFQYFTPTTIEKLSEVLIQAGR